jgi:hypothetical protein
VQLDGFGEATPDPVARSLAIRTNAFVCALVEGPAVLLPQRRLSFVLRTAIPST